jgi:hypothetical protein
MLSLDLSRFIKVVSKNLNTPICMCVSRIVTNPSNQYLPPITIEKCFSTNSAVFLKMSILDTTTALELFKKGFSSTYMVEVMLQLSAITYVTNFFVDTSGIVRSRTIANSSEVLAYYAPSKFMKYFSLLQDSTIQSTCDINHASLK